MNEQLAFLDENQFIHNNVPGWEAMPLPDAPYVETWQEYIADINRHGFIEALRPRLVQLGFPVREGMSTDTDYQTATRKGIVSTAVKAVPGKALYQADELKVYLHQTMAGRIPVIESNCRPDFETLVQTFSYRNEPVNIPASMGACMIKGYNNWDRVARYKRQCGASFDFNQMKSQKDLYQDVFLLLTEAEYSGVPAEILGLATDDWRHMSRIIRREHEAAHYCTLRILGSARNHLLDEFIADYMGIVAAWGRYRADWFLCFMGLENYPDFRPGGRITNYLKNIELSEDAFTELKTCIKNAACNVEKYADAHPEVYSEQGKYEMFIKLTKSKLTDLASKNAQEILSGL